MTDVDLLADPAPNRSALAARGFVARLSRSQLLLSEVRRTGADEFRATAQWPRIRNRAHDPLLVTETLRQLGVYLPLRCYGVAADSRVLIEELRFELTRAADDAPPPYKGTEVICTATVDRGARYLAADKLRNLDLAVRLFVGDRELARAHGTARMLGPAAYRAVRNRRPEPAAPENTQLNPVDPARVGVPRPQDVLVAVDARGAVRIAPADPNHPFLHDHPSDHMTGMVLVGAVQQTAALHANDPNLRLRSCTLRALRFTEPAPPATVEFGPDGRFEIRQRGTVTATGEAEFEL
ncbi:MAG TPA: AfsA-related hotdog domain-containing protein [Actinospica sp.]|nr:AfsA-related hotdog domain-containing protein [Actinospica sp.]